MSEVFKVSLDRIQQRLVEQIFVFLQRLPSTSLTFQFRVVAEIFLLQRRLPVCRVRQIKGFFALFTGRKKVQRSRAPRGRNWVPSRAHGCELSWGLFGGTTWGAASSPCCCEGRVVLPGLLLWFTLLPSGLEQLLVQTVLGYQSVMEAFGRISSSTCPLPRYSHLEIWTWPSPLYLSVLCLGVASGARCIRDACLVQQWIHVLREAFGELHTFSSCGELRSEAFTLHSAELRSVHS